MTFDPRTTVKESSSESLTPVTPPHAIGMVTMETCTETRLEDRL